MTIEYEAERLTLRNTWVVRPAGQIGTMGWSPCAWFAVFVTAKTEEEALKKAMRVRKRTGYA